ncbi:ABC transporter ATP-binding protein [Allosaccharopolyspora coralli]|nr:ABC transporter ATP-binding protein [Allosaccharopolyspora coralli]
MALGGLTRGLRRLGAGTAGDGAAALRTAGNRVLADSARRAPWMVAAVVATTLVQVVATLLVPAATAVAIDAAVRGDGLGSALGRLALLLMVMTAAMGADELVSAYFGSALTADLRHRLVRSVLGLGTASTRRFPPGDVVARLTENAASPASFLPTLLSALATVLTTLGAVVGLAVIDGRLALTFLAGVPLAVLLLRVFLTQAGDAMLQYQQRLASLAARLLDAHRGARTIRASGTVEQDIDRVLAPLPGLNDSGRAIWSAQRGVSWQISLLVPMLQVAVLAVGGYALSTGSITAGQLVAASSYVALALGIVGVLDSLVALLTCQVGAGRVAEVLDSPRPVTTPVAPVSLPNGRGRLDLRGVRLREGETTVLDGLDLSVHAGTCVALVGRSGAGKSALASLVGRLRDPDDGTVLLDGVDVSTVDPHELRKSVAYAFERPAMLGETVADLIGYGTQPTERGVRQAAEVAQAAGFIRLLPDGVATPLDRAPMSGGELQRLSLARAVLRDARLLVLDDATSSLDTATELKVAEGIDQVRGDRTALVVAHRVATAARADLVAWLDDGRVRAIAPHRRLWSDPGYREIFSARLDAEHDENPDTVVRT